MNHVDEHALLSMPVASFVATGTAFPLRGKTLRDKGRPSGRGMVGKGVKFQRIRRITGYLVGDIIRFNNAKRKEEHDRVKHG